MSTRHEVKATSFADPADVAAFHHAKSLGMSDEEAFKHGDNGIGCWGDDCTKGLWVALPPETMIETWGSVASARHQIVSLVCEKTRTEIAARVGDRMPHRANITNGAGIDMSPDTCAALGLAPPVSANVAWFLPEHY